MIYYEISDLYVENVPSKILEDTFKRYSYIKFYAFIIHNRTKGVKHHYHCMIQVDLNNKKAKSKIEKDLKDLKPFVKCLRNPKGFARYLLHTDYVDKEKYDIKELYCSNIEQFNDLYNVETKVSKCEYLLQEYFNYLITNDSPPSHIVLFKWFLDRGQGNYFICHSKTLVDMANRLQRDQLYFEELERRYNIDVRSVNSCSDYSIDNLV